MLSLHLCVFCGGKQKRGLTSLTPDHDRHRVGREERDGDRSRAPNAAPRLAAGNPGTPILLCTGKAHLASRGRGVDQVAFQPGAYRDASSEQRTEGMIDVAVNKMNPKEINKMNPKGINLRHDRLHARATPPPSLPRRMHAWPE